MTIAELLAAIARAREPIELANAFAAAMASHTGPLAFVADDAHAKNRAIEVLRGARRTGFLDDTELEALRHTVSGLAAPQANAARAGVLLLGAIDEALGEHLGEQLEDRAPFFVEPGQVVPVATVDLAALLPAQTSFTARSAKLHLPHLRLEHLAIVPSIPGMPRVRLDMQGGAGLSGLLVTKSVVALCPNEDLTDEFEAEFDFQRRTFFGVRARDENAQWLSIKTALELAEQSRAPLVLLPELTSSVLIDSRLSDWFRRSADAAHLVVGGSLHVDDDGRRNRCITRSVGRREAMCHDKFNPYEWSGPSCVLREDLANDPQVTLHWSRGLTFTTLVCKDLLNPQARAVLAALRPCFVFVPAMSPVTEELVDAARHLALDCQTITIICNLVGNASAPGDSALAVLPVRGKGAVIASRPATAPSAFLLDLNVKHLDWRPLT